MDIRTAALKKCYATEGYADLPLEEKNRIYDATVKEITEGAEMTRQGRYSVFLTGSKHYAERTVYEDEQKRYWIKWYGKYIEVKRGTSGYYTAEPY